MKRRGRSVLVFLSLFLVAAVSIAFYVRHARAVPHEEVAVAPPPPTWSQFDHIAHFQMLLEGFGIESVLDLPASDLDILTRFRLPIKKYIGGAQDQEESMKLQAQYGGATRSFYSLDISLDPLPTVDLILCWDRLSLLPQNEVEWALLTCKKSGSKFLMLTHSPAVETNPEGASSSPRPINWRKAPYYLPEPLILFPQKEKERKEYFALWSLKELP